ncbi:unnamed protein product [Sphenostylis stenocarpa]|uniref:Uncharacterized protein n=1 Tax=Sphenostylis stenocarpa TaxID=92480 RepID=A0AA86W2L4_9FABA|nr:unnamed protein product [Sphenostylis stenocarpa]
MEAQMGNLEFKSHNHMFLDTQGSLLEKGLRLTTYPKGDKLTLNALVGSIVLLHTEIQ